MYCSVHRQGWCSQDQFKVVSCPVMSLISWKTYWYLRTWCVFFQLFLRNHIAKQCESYGLFFPILIHIVCCAPMMFAWTLPIVGLGWVVFFFFRTQDSFDLFTYICLHCPLFTTLLRNISHDLLITQHILMIYWLHMILMIYCFHIQPEFLNYPAW